MEKKVKKSVNDLGIAAYLSMHGFAVVGRKGRTIIFDIKEEESEEFEKLTFEYLSSSYHRFDACLMALKKMNEFVPVE